MSWRSSFVRVIFVLVIIGVVSAGSVIWREHERGKRIQAEIDMLEREADKIRRENESLEEKIMYFASPDFHEREAKEKLGFRRLEEEVIVFQGTPGPSGDSIPKEVLPAAADEGDPMKDAPNYRKWWALFFR